jgi:hypothetical protein
MALSPERALRHVLEVARQAGASSGSARVEPAEVLAALESVHALRDLLTRLEPLLIATARKQGVSWAALADVLGVASRQAAERRYLRLQPTEAGHALATADQRVQAVRDRRAADRAVIIWARENSASLRRLAGHVSSLDDLTGAAQRSVALVHRALAHDDTYRLLEPLAAVALHLRPTHPVLAEQISQLVATAAQLRRQTHDDRRSRG